MYPLQPINMCVGFKNDLPWCLILKVDYVGAHKFAQPFYLKPMLFTVLSQSLPENDSFFI